jgi:hypothetical protein
MSPGGYKAHEIHLVAYATHEPTPRHLVAAPAVLALLTACGRDGRGGDPNDPNSFIDPNSIAHHDPNGFIDPNDPNSADPNG